MHTKAPLLKTQNKLKHAIYAGSFDPWTFGHQYVLDAALKVFDVVHIVSAIHPSKKSALKPDLRARVIAYEIDPFMNWWNKSLPFLISDKIIVTCQEGLIADYAEKEGIQNLIRGLRSTTDFESEFNLYFSNQAINPDLKTWAVMCPPELLHCSSTYVRTVVGKHNVKFVGTSFLSQSFMLGWSFVIGQIFDLICLCSKARFHKNLNNLKFEDFRESMQITFTNLYLKQTKISRSVHLKTEKLFFSYLKSTGEELKKKVLLFKEYPEKETNELWAIFAACLEENKMLPQEFENAAQYILDCSKKLGKTEEELFSLKSVVELLS